jgi:hypothetical protein
MKLVFVSHPSDKLDAYFGEKALRLPAKAAPEAAVRVVRRFAQIRRFLFRHWILSAALPLLITGLWAVALTVAIHRAVCTRMFPVCTIRCRASSAFAYGLRMYLDPFAFDIRYTTPRR